jgi:hypothetical protein
MVTELAKLADLIALDSLPLWMRQQIDEKRDEILEALETKGVFVLEGPQGQRVEIRTTEKRKHAAA